MSDAKSTFSLTDTDTKADSLTFDGLLSTYYQFLNDNPVIVDEIKTAPNVFKKLNRYFEDEQAKRELEGVKSMPKEDVWLTQLYGMKVMVDPDMKPGTWKFVYRGEDSKDA